MPMWSFMAVAIMASHPTASWVLRSASFFAIIRSHEGHFRAFLIGRRGIARLSLILEPFP